MRNASSAFKYALDHGAPVVIKFKLIKPTGEYRWIEGRQIVANSVKFKNSTSSDGSFDIGGAIIGALAYSLFNFDDAWTNYDFSNNIIEAYAGFETDDLVNILETEESENILTQGGGDIQLEEARDTQLETVRMGQYYMTSHKAVGNIMRCEAYDGLILLDRNIANVTFNTSTTALGIIQQICNARGIILATATIPHGDMVISSLPDEEMTERQLLSYVLQMIGCYARMDSEGRLYVGWYDLSSTYDINVVFSTNFQTKDVLFNGVRITAENDLSYSTTSELGHIVEISGNPLINESNIETVATNILNALPGAFTAGEFKCKSSPLYEVGDVFRVTDANGATRTVIATSVTYTGTLQETISCGAKEEEVDDLRSTQLATTTSRIRKAQAKKISTIEANFQAFSQILGASFGLYHTEQIQADGSTIYYLHDQPDLEDSKAVWKATANAFAVTNDYNAENPDASPWTAGVDKNGNMIAQVLTAIGINVEWINLDGTLRDSENNNWWNLKTGEFHLSAYQTYADAASIRQQDLSDISESFRQNRDYIDGQITDSKAYTDAQASAAETSAKNYADTQASTAEQNAKSYTDDELSDMNAAWDADFTEYQTTVSHRFDVMSDEFSSRIETAKTEVSTHYFLPQDYSGQWRSMRIYNACRSYVSSVIRNGRKCTCLDGTSLTAWNASYGVLWYLNFDGGGTAKTRIEFEIEGIAEGENLSRMVFFPFVYYPATQTGAVYASGSMWLSITDGVVHLQLYDGTEISPVDGTYSATLTKVTSATDTQEDLRIYFIPGHKVYIYDTQITMTSDAYTDSTVSLISQKTDSIQLQIDQISENARADFIPSDFATDLSPWYTGEETEIVTSSTFDGNPCVVIDGSNAGSATSEYSDAFILYGINLTQPGTYTFQFTYASDAAVPNNLRFGQFNYGTVNPNPNRREAVPVVFAPATNSVFRTKTAAANEPMVYTGSFTIPAETTITDGGTSYTAATDIRTFTYQGVDIGTCALWIYLPAGAHGYLYNFSLLGTATDYAKSVLSVARSEISAEVTRATNAESSLDSRITQTENSITSEVTARQQDYQTLSTAITQTAQAIESKVSKGDIASTINQTAQAVLIDASKINLNGYVTVSSLGAGGSTTIDGSRITTGQISAERIALGDFNNLSQLDEKSYARWGFWIQSRSEDGIWYEYTPVRDKYVSDYYTVNGGEYYRVKCRLWSTCTGATTTGGEGGTYMKTGIGLYCYKGDGSGAGIVYSNRVTATESGAYATIDQQIQIPATARKMRIFIQTDGRPPFAGRIEVQNLTVTRAMTGELVVDGAINGHTITGAVFKSASKGSLTDANAGIYISKDGLALGKSKTFYVDANGALIATSATISGAITATSLTLGSGASIAASKVTGLSNVAKSGSYTDLSNKPTIPSLTGYIKTDGTIGTIGSGKNGFRVSSAGLLQASNAVIYGTIYASAGTIGGITIASNAIYTNAKTGIDTARDGVHISASGISLGNGKFKVTSGGALTANSATIKGTITGSTIGSTTISASTILVGNAAQNTAKLFISGATGDVWTGNLNIMTGDGTPIGGWYQDYDKRWNATSQNGKYLRILTGYGIHVGSTTGANGVNAYSIFSGGVVFEQQVYNNSGNVMFTSDIRKKKDVHDLSSEDVISFVMQLRPVSFRFKSDEEERLHHGFIAQEVEEIIDADWAIVDTDENDEEQTKYLAYDELIADLVTVVQEQQKKIDSLEARIAKLEDLLGA